MIDLYMWSTTNSRRASIALEEAGLAYRVHPIDLGEKAQRAPEHTARNPYQKIPVIVDPDGPGGKPVTIFESGAILLYAAEKSQSLYGEDAQDRVEVQKWFMLHMNGSVPILGFLKNHGGLRGDAERVCSVIDGHLASSRYFAKSLSIADLAFYPRVAGLDPAIYPIRDHRHIARWIDELGTREGIRRGMAQPG